MAKRHRPITIWASWSPAMGEIFRLAPLGWRPPAKIKIVRSAERMTLSGEFILPNGAATLALVRFRKNHHAGWEVIEEQLQCRLRTEAR